MTNLEKMIELSGHEGATKEEVMNWAFINRIFVCSLELDLTFEPMKLSVDHWIDNNHYSSDEHENWPRFLDAEYVGGESSE